MYFHNRYGAFADELVVGLSSRLGCNDSVSGGKGSSLAQMLQMHLGSGSDAVEIPQGIIVTTMAFTKHLQENTDLKTSLEELQLLSYQVSCKTASMTQLESHCQKYDKHSFKIR